ncbi:orotate phosphoribosyltransferase [Spiroplasma tabanidicola]|uniref:Orotate phosphoribosyltransferase n=1 Tax=Spiroplasma tabanidicola TaxID=324079 RepID=A0A6I6C8Q3_9MOLU|nr:orotate phosphoribosyltransferase [Spiroplasma tabanidicola]QGS52046.1 orotate phosphoribosyltransferase [Spiroplasma tabanidicola]
MDKQLITDILIDTNAISLNFENKFTWASGIISPIYCDNRVLLSFVKQRDIIIDSFIDSIKKNYPNVELIAGVATSGIGFAAMISQKMGLPMIYVRTKSKDHGKNSQVEGIIKENQKIVVIEDLISTGQSVLNVCEVLKTNKSNVLGVQAIFTYDLLKAKTNFANQNVILNTLSNRKFLIKSMKKSNSFTDENINDLYIFFNSLG